MASDLLNYRLQYAMGIWFYSVYHPLLEQPLSLHIYRRNKPTAKQLRKQRNRAHKRWHKAKRVYANDLELAKAVKGTYCHLDNHIKGAKASHVAIVRRQLATVRQSNIENEIAGHAPDYMSARNWKW